MRQYLPKEVRASETPIKRRECLLRSCCWCKAPPSSGLTSACVSPGTTKLAVGPGHGSATDGLLPSRIEHSWGWTGPLSNPSMLP